MQVGNLVKYKKLEYGHHIGHKYGMIGVITGVYPYNQTKMYAVHWLNPPINLDTTAIYTPCRLEVLCK